MGLFPTKLKQYYIVVGVLYTNCAGHCFKMEYDQRMFDNQITNVVFLLYTLLYMCLCQKKNVVQEWLCINTILIGV